VDRLNYHHLRYFWATAREGSVTRASERLNISQPTVTAQIRKLEHALGEKLLARSGRGLTLTEAGRLVYRYAEEIFGMGSELLDALEGRPTGRPVRLAVGIANVLPKLVAYRLLEPALHLPEPVQIQCFEDRPERLLAELAVQGLDIVLADAPVSPTVKVRAFTHLLGHCGVAIFGTERLARKYGSGFPKSLTGAPFLVPTDNTALRRSLEQWFEARGIRPRVVAEFEDSALLKVFGEAGAGLFPAPAAIEAEIRERYDVRRVGILPGLREHFYVISLERRLGNPAVVAISQSARKSLFAPIRQR
jgi:LysR family transcriptional activator of nhaA